MNALDVYNPFVLLYPDTLQPSILIGYKNTPDCRRYKLVFNHHFIWQYSDMGNLRPLWLLILVWFFNSVQPLGCSAWSCLKPKFGNHLQIQKLFANFLSYQFF